MPATRLPLTTLLSQVLVAYIIEFDNEFERQMPHRTTDHGATAPRGPWLTSLVIWTNFLRFVPEEGITVREFYLRTGLEKQVFKQRLKRMSRWWGYLTFLPPPGSAKSSPPADWIVLPSEAGRKAWQIWPSLFEEIETRWRTHHGDQAIDQLREALTAIAQQLDTNLPEAMPILNVVWAGWFAEPPTPPTHPTPVESRTPHLSAMLSKTLQAITLDFERQSELSLAMGSNLVRVLNDTGTPLRELPRLTGISKEAIKMMLGFLTKHKFVAVEPSPTLPRTKQVRLTAKGIESQHAFRQNLAAAEKRWQKAYGKEAVQTLRTSLESLAVPPKTEPSPILASVKSNPAGWRAQLPDPETLPHHPLILHRGGYPDGA